MVVDPNMWATMTGKERGKYLHGLLKAKKSFILNGVRHVYDSNLGPISMSFGGSHVSNESPSRAPAPPNLER